MDTKSREQNSTETAIPCDKCRYVTDCASIHDNVAPHCGLQTCEICSSIAQLNDEISEGHNKLIKLIKQRYALKTQFNHHHKRPIDRLPFELISKIFLLRFLDCDYFPYDDHRLVWIPLSLGAVCKPWRNVTLRMPQLWTAVKFTVRYGAPLYHFDVAKKWLHRSGSLPLSIVINLQSSKSPTDSQYVTSFDAMIALIRSHSTRWNRIDIQSSHAFFFYQLLVNLECMPDDLESLSIGWCRKHGLPSFNSESAVLLPRFISQIQGHFESVGLWDLPCGFERLTSIELEAVPIDEVLYFILHAPNLKRCTALFINSFDSEDFQFSLPNIPIISPSMTLLEIDTSSKILQYLTLPSLQTLEHECYWMTGDNNDLNILATFLERSSPPLQTFNLTVGVWYAQISTWYEILPTITSLTLEVNKGMASESKTECMITEDFLAALARTGPSVVLPNLEYLSLMTRGMSPASWASLCNVFQGSEPIAAESPDEADVVVQATVGHERLKKIEIALCGSDWERYLSMEEMVFKRFENLKDAGIEHTVHTPHGPEFVGSVFV